MYNYSPPIVTKPSAGRVDITSPTGGHVTSVIVGPNAITPTKLLFSHFEGETQFSLALPFGIFPDLSLTGTAELAVATTANSKYGITVQPVPPKQGFNDLGGLDIIFTLQRKPAVSSWTFALGDNTGVSAYWQPPLSQSEVDAGVIRPAHVVNSIAFYLTTPRVNEEGGKDYKVGKVAHLYRMQANGHWFSWSMPDATHLVLSDDDGYLQTANYPLTIAPVGDTIGYSSVGGSGASTSLIAQLYGTYTAPAGKAVTSLNAYIVSGGGGGTEMGIYTFQSGAPYAKVGSPPYVARGTGPTWRTVSVSIPLTNGTTYTVACVPTLIALDVVGGVYYCGETNGQWDSYWVNTAGQNYIWSFYAGVGNAPINAWKNIATRFRLVVTKDISTRFKTVVQKYKDAQTRFAVTVRAYKDASTRFKLTVRAFKDAATRFRLGVAKDITTRVRIAVQGFKDSGTRYTVTTGTVAYKFIQSRFSIVVRGFKDAPTRYKVWARQYKDPATRYLLTVRGWKDAAARFKLYGTSYKDVATRYRLYVQRFKDAATRYALTVRAFKDAATRYRLVVQAYKDVSVRYRLNARGWGNAASRFILTVLNYAVAKTRFVLVAMVFKDAAARFKVSVLGHKNAALRFVMNGLGQRDAATRFALQLISFRDAVCRFSVCVYGEQYSLSLATRQSGLTVNTRDVFCNMPEREIATAISRVS